MTTYKKPIPIPDSVSEEYWNGAKRHELMIQHCKRCSAYVHYPRAICPRCLSDSLEWVQACGKGRVYSYTVVIQNAAPGFREEVPYIYAVVELDEGPHMFTNIVDCPIDECKIDMPVTVVFDDITPEVTLPKFKPIR
ncbi:MAG: Zn-ribbon domain-containing OB-fold protein [Chloroflexi bacterium]|nr:Zn-ribbon domain-containing OB-fold protein [Chloroflexota bacterium]